MIFFIDFYNIKYPQKRQWNEINVYFIQYTRDNFLRKTYPMECFHDELELKFTETSISFQWRKCNVVYWLSWYSSSFYLRQNFSLWIGNIILNLWAVFWVLSYCMPQKWHWSFFVKVFNLWQSRICTGKKLIAACNFDIYIQQVPVIHFAF